LLSTLPPPILADNLALNNLRISGTIPPEIWRIESLEALIVDNSYKLGGTLSTDIGTQGHLKLLSMESTKLEGTIPTEIGLATSLLWVNLLKTRLSGTVPAEMTRLTKLRDLNMAVADLSGTAPPGLCPEKFAMTCQDGDPVRCDCCTTCYPRGFF